jgi:type I site-specific restriction endonuclease
MTSEADTCRKYILPKLYAAGWTDDQIREQRTFTDGRIVAEFDTLQAEVDKLKRLQAESADELDAFLPSILDRVFRAER